MRKVQFVSIVSDFSISNYIYSTDCSFLIIEIYQVSLIVRPRRHPQTLQYIYPISMSVQLKQINTRIFDIHTFTRALQLARALSLLPSTPIDHCTHTHNSENMN